VKREIELQSAQEAEGESLQSARLLPGSSDETASPYHVKTMEGSATQRVYRLLQIIPRGYVTTYGDLSRAAEVHSAQAVGQILHRNPDPVAVPCYKVVFADGKLSSGYAAGGLEEQRKRLELDGIRVVGNAVDLQVARFVFP